MIAVRIAPMIGQHRCHDVARRQREQRCLHHALEIGLSETLRAVGGRCHVVLACGGNGRAVDEPERIEASGADRVTAIRRVEQVLNLALQDRILIRLQVVSRVVRCEHVPRPVLQRQASPQSSQVLRRRVLLIPGLDRKTHVSSIPGEGCVRIRPRRKQRAQIGRDEGIGDRNCRQGAELREAAAAAGEHVGVDIQHLAVDGDLRRERIVDLAEHRLPLQWILDDGLGSDGHSHVTGENGITVRGRTPIVLRARLREQRSVIVEPQVERILDRRGGAVAAEQCIHGRLAGQVGRRRHERPLSDE